MPVTAVIFLVLLLVGSFAAIFIDASYGILLYVLEYFLNPPGRWWGHAIPDLRYAFTVGIIVFISYMIRTKRYSKSKVFDIPQTKWLMLMVLLIVMTFPIAVSQTEHQKFMILIVKYAIFYYLVVKTIDTPIKFERLAWVFMAGQFYLGWLAYEMGRGASGRLEKLGGADSRDANSAAALLISAIPIALHYLIYGKRLQKIMSLIFLVFILNAVILVNSRGAFIGILVALSYYFICIAKSAALPKFDKIKVLSAFLVGGLLFLYLADPIFLDRMKTITLDEETTQGYTGRERIEFWMKSFDMVRDHPWGTGAFGYDYLSSQYLPAEVLNPRTRTRAVHSLYFQALAEYGYHGFFLYMIMLFSAFRFMWKARKYLKEKNMPYPITLGIAFESSLISILISGIFISTLYMEINYWLLAFLGAFGNIYYKSKSVSSQKVSPIDYEQNKSTAYNTIT
jgi:O-antigen ligase